MVCKQFCKMFQKVCVLRVMACLRGLGRKWLIMTPAHVSTQLGPRESPWVHQSASPSWWGAAQQKLAIKQSLVSTTRGENSSVHSMLGNGVLLCISPGNQQC